MGTAIAICTTICISSIIFMILFFKLMDKKITLDYNNRVEITNLEKQRFYSTIDREKFVLEIESFINSVIDEYCLLYVNNTDEPYITQKMQDDIIDQVMLRLPDKLSPSIIAKIKLCMNIKDSNDILNYLKYVTSLGVMKKVLETNRLEPEGPVDIDKESNELLGSIIDDYNLRSNF